MKLIFSLFCCFYLSSCGYKIVDTGHRGVRVVFGKVTGEPMPEGLYFFNPITTTIKELSVREQKHEQKTLCYSKDAQLVEIKYTVNIMPSANEIHNIYKEVGFEWQEVLLKQILEGNIKEVTGKYTAVDLIEKRQETTDQITNKLDDELAAKRIKLISFEINDMDFDDDFETAVKNKVIAVEEAKEAVNKTVRVREEAQQKIIAAKAEAESMRIRSNALTANRSLVEYEAVQKWDGKLPTQMFGNSVPFINIKGK